jgi:iron complex transport system substrate-binding protein
MKPLVLLALAMVLAASNAQAQIALFDDAGKELRLARPAQRIVTLAPHATELLFAAGAGGRIIATVEFSDFPPEAKRLPRVGGYETLDVERIVALRPDLVIAWGSGNPQSVIDQLRSLGIPLFVSEPRSLDDVATALQTLGRLAGAESTANHAAAEFRRRAAEIRARYSTRSPVKVFYQVWDQPLMTVNDAHLISKVLQLCGGRSVFGSLSTLTPTVDVEAVLAADPEIVIGSEEAGARSDALDLWQRWPRLTATRRGNIFQMPPDILVRHAPRILDAAQIVCERLEAVRAARAIGR